MGTRLYVGNLSFSATEDELREHFTQAGTPGLGCNRQGSRDREVARIRVRRDGHGRRGSGGDRAAGRQGLQGTSAEDRRGAFAPGHAQWWRETAAAAWYGGAGSGRGGAGGFDRH